MDPCPLRICPGRRRQLLVLLAGMLLATARPAIAQRFDQYATDTTQVFSYVDQLPTLPDGGDNLALIKAIQKLVQLPAEVREGRLEGRVFVRVVVGVSGVGRKAALVQSLSPACDAAALAAVKRMPRLRPALYQGQPVAALLTLPVMFLSPHHVFAATEVARPARFPGGDAALEAYLLQHKTLPAEVQQRDLQGRVTLRFVVKPDGRVGAMEVINSLCPSCDDEALRLVRSFPRWQPAQGYDDQPVAQYQVLHVWFRPGPPPPRPGPTRARKPGICSGRAVAHPARPRRPRRSPICHSGTDSLPRARGQRRHPGEFRGRA